MTINIIGDSHALCFDGAEDVICHWVGARTAYNLYKRYDTTKTLFSSLMDEYWFCFGEIDCRLHIYSQWKLTGQKRGSLIEDTIDSYLGAIGVFDGWKTSVMAVPPQGYEENIYDYEYYASQRQRQQFTDVFNLLLEDQCMSLGIPFIDIWAVGYNELPETEFSWPKECFKEDMCHIKNEVAIPLLDKYRETK